MLKIYPSLLAASKRNYELKNLAPHCAGFHLDIMDGIFVPSTGLSIEMVNKIDAATQNPSWVHLMVKDPLSWISKLALKTDSIVSFHGQGQKDLAAIVQKIKGHNWKASLAVSPKTAIASCYPYLQLLDQLLIMTVEPGYSGQPFLPAMMAKVAPLIEQRKKQRLDFSIAMDGAINQKNIALIAAAGIDAVAIGSGIFTEPDPVQALKKLDQLGRSAVK